MASWSKLLIAGINSFVTKSSNLTGPGIISQSAMAFEVRIEAFANGFAPVLHAALRWNPVGEAALDDLDVVRHRVFPLAVLRHRLEPGFEEDLHRGSGRWVMKTLAFVCIRLPPLDHLLVLFEIVARRDEAEAGAESITLEARWRSFGPMNSEMVAWSDVLMLIASSVPSFRNKAAAFAEPTETNFTSFSGSMPSALIRPLATTVPGAVNSRTPIFFP